MIKFFIFFTTTLLYSAQAEATVHRERLRFKISASGLSKNDVDSEKFNPYVEVFYVDNEHTAETKLNQTEPISNTSNPNWDNIFEFDYDRSKGQRWRFLVQNDDGGGDPQKNGTVGRGWMSVDDYVDQGQNYTLKMADNNGTLHIESAGPAPVLASDENYTLKLIDKNDSLEKPPPADGAGMQVLAFRHNYTLTFLVENGTLFIQKAFAEFAQNITKMANLSTTLPPPPPPPTTTMAPTSLPIQLKAAPTLLPAAAKPAASLKNDQPTQLTAQPATVVSSQQENGQKLTFGLSARGLPDTDLFGTIDPYVKLFYHDRVTKLDQQFGRTVPIQDDRNPNFRDIFQFNYVPGKKQKWHFMIFDDDQKKKQDDFVGEAFVDVEEFVKMRQSPVTLQLAEGELLIFKLT